MAKSRFRKTGGYTEELKKRTEQSTGGGFITIFRDDLNLPIWKEPKEGDVGIDIIPYIASANHPQAKECAPVYKLELWVHTRVGPEKGDYVCLRNFGQECPLCQARYDELASANPRKKIADDLKGSHRAIYNVVVVTNEKEEAKGVQIWTASTYLAEQHFQSTAKNRKTGEKIPFSCPDTGRTIWFTVEGSKLTKAFAGITLEERPEPISDDILDAAFTLEECIIIPKKSDLQKIAEIIVGSGNLDDDDLPDPPSRRGRSTQDDEPPRRRAAKEPEEDTPPPRRRAAQQEEDEPPRRRAAQQEEDGDQQEDDGNQQEEEDTPPTRKRITKEEEDEPPRRRAAKEPEEDTPPPRRRSTQKDDGDAPPRRTRIRREE